MAKVFRLHEGQDGSGWFTSNPPTKEQLKDIKTLGKEVATSIPSPFARIDLVKSAFQWVADNGIDGNTAQHKLVSNALDVGQLFFLYPKYDKQIKIVSWDPSNRFTELKNSSNPQHSLFAQTLNIFWDQDAQVYNFDKVNRLYFILNKINNQVIGGTSPATLFFASPDVNNAMNGLSIKDGMHTFFGSNFTSLINRDKSFILYLYSLSKQSKFPDYFKEVFRYLDVCKTNLNNSLQSKIAQLTAEDLNSYELCPVLDNNNNPCEVLNINLRVQKPQSIEMESDFVIKPDYILRGLKPLVLPNTTFNQEWTYTVEGVKWDRNNVISEKNSQASGSSILPIQGDHYDWLSMGNFLEDKIIKLPYYIDGGKFSTCGSTNYLLPLTPTFFQYFTPGSVMEYLIIENLSGGGVDVKLEIPVRKGKIIFKKTYSRVDIVELEIHMAILPFLRTKAINIDYTIGIQDLRYNKNENFAIEVFEKGVSTLLIDGVVRKPDEEGSLNKSIYYRSKKFDSIRLINGAVSGFIVPKMKEYSSNQNVSFAIDLGTTNTHIEYTYGGNVAKSLDSTSILPLWQSLMDIRKDNSPEQIISNDEFERELMPYQFAENHKYQFPFRTALTYNNDINFNQPLEVFRHVNNYFLLEKVFYTQAVKVHTKLKWGNYEKPEDKKLIESYIDHLLYLSLFKTILLNGDPRSTKITWFYPVSMDSFELGIFSNAWHKSYLRIFEVDNLTNITRLPESIAPYLHYRANYPGLSLSLDIGGGSSDIAVFQNANQAPEFISSFRFAGNSIFGDGYMNSSFSNNADTNGYVNAFKELAENAINSITNIDAGNIKEIFKNIIQNRKDSSDFSSFLFSLENQDGIDFNYTDLLREDRKLKLPILLFFGAVIYYSANLLNKKEIKQIPRNLLLSGTAAKTIKIIDANNDFPNISKLFEFIFKKVMGIPDGELKIALAKNPKEITCKGALKANINTNIGSDTVFWMGGINDNDESTVWDLALNKTTNISDNPLYSDLTDKVKRNLENSLNEFFTLLDSYFKNVDIESNFGIDKKAYSRFQEIRSKNIISFLEQGLKAFNKSPGNHIEETLFFYPLIGILRELAFDLSNMED